MVKVFGDPDCNNAPKKALMRDFTIAFANSDEQTILNAIADDIHWEMVGQQTIKGKANFKENIQDMLDGSTETISFETVISHGDEGSVSGWMQFKDGTKFAFCDVYTFTSHAKDAKIKTLKSFIIELAKESK